MIYNIEETYAPDLGAVIKGGVQWMKATWRSTVALKQ